MKIVTLNIPKKFLEMLDKLVDERLYPSRSEAIRAALRRFLPKEMMNVEWMIKVLE